MEKYWADHSQDIHGHDDTQGEEQHKGRIDCLLPASERNVTWAEARRHALCLAPAGIMPVI